jgi:hypothetical protein
LDAGAAVRWSINFQTETADIATSTTWAFTGISSSIDYDVYIRGTGFTYGPVSGRLQSGSITTLETFAREGRVEGSYVTLEPPQLTQGITFATPVSATLLNDYHAQVDALKSAISAMTTGPIGELTTSSPIQPEYTAWDGDLLPVFPPVMS